MPSRTRSRRAAAQSSRPARSTKPTRNRVSYRELSTDGSDAVSDDEPLIVMSQQKRRAMSSVPSPGRPDNAAPSKKRRTTTPRRSKYILGAKKSKPSTEINGERQEDAILSLGGRVPPWQSLSYHILLPIFRFASESMKSDQCQTPSNTTWLLRVAYMCKAFAEPALSVLYWSPPLVPPRRAHNLLASLASQTENSTFNYKAKIKHLEMEALSTLTHKYGGRDPIDLAELIAHTPQLRGVDIHYLTDTPMLHKAKIDGQSRNRDVYRLYIFNALEQTKVSLTHWTWNSSIAGMPFAALGLRHFHLTSPFQSLRELTLVNYQSGGAGRVILDNISGQDLVVFAPSAPKRFWDPSEEQLAHAVECLPNLKRLRFKMSSAVNQKFLDMISRDLELLEITDCSSVESEMLESFLVNHGHNIRELILDHNQALALSFLTVFATACPKVETLKMNLTYYNSHFCFSNSDPRFSKLLHSGEVPTWPASLQHLELLHLRRWDMDTAEAFFSSLVDSAKSLPNLRHLDIKASLDESGWRDRVAFRDRWAGRLQTVFLRKPFPPNPHIRSIDDFKAHKAQMKRQNEYVKPPGESSRPILRRKRSDKFSHIEVSQNTASAKLESDNESKNPPISTRRVTRQSNRLRKSLPAIPARTKNPFPSRYPSRRHRRHPLGEKPSDTDSSSQDSALDDDSPVPTTPPTPPTDEKELHIQGMCDVVHVMIDNLRPMEQQLNESNFLDEEASGDEDWNGDDSEAGGGFAW